MWSRVHLGSCLLRATLLLRCRTRALPTAQRGGYNLSIFEQEGTTQVFTVQLEYFRRVKLKYFRRAQLTISNDVLTENGSSKGQNLALNGLFVPGSLDSSFAPSPHAFGFQVSDSAFGPCQVPDFEG